MSQDEIKVDPNALRIVMTFIQRYIIKQQDLLRECSTKMKKLSYDWEDQKGYGDMMQTLDLVTKNSIESLEQIDKVYRKFLFDEIMDIERKLSAISGKN